MFDLDRFIATVAQAQNALRGETAGDAPRLEVILELRDLAERDRLEQRLQETLRVDLSTAPLFPGSDTSPLLGADELARFYRVTIPGIDAEHLGQNPFELCYFLRDGLGLASAEPSTPLIDSALSSALEDQGPWSVSSDSKSSGSSGSGGDCGVRSGDRGWSLRNMRVDRAWQLTPGPGGKPRGEGVLIGQPDTGYCDHVDLQPPTLAKELGRNFIEGGPDAKDRFTGGLGTNPGHGGSVASIIIGRGTLVAPPPPGQTGGTAGPGICAGVAPAARLVPVRAVTGVALIKGEGLAEGIWHATRTGCGVISLSLGGLWAIEAVTKAIEVAVRNDRIVVCAAGNHYPGVVFPASLGYVVAAGGSNINDKHWSGSGWGRGVVDVAAPAECVWTCWRSKDSDPINSVGTGSGTSYATSNLAAAAALWIAFHGPRIADFKTGGQTLCAAFKNLLRRTARVPAGWDTSYGTGIADAHALLQARPAVLAEAPAELPEASSDPRFATLLAALGVEAGSPQAKTVQDELAAAFGVEPSGLSRPLAAYGTELLTLLTQQRSRQGAGAPAAGRNPAEDLLRTVHEDASPTLAAALQGLAAAV